jgi:hypothetical protein
VDPGTAIFPGSPLLVLETTANPQVLAEMPTAQAVVLRAGLEVGVRISDALSQRAFDESAVGVIDPVDFVEATTMTRWSLEKNPAPGTQAAVARVHLPERRQPFRCGSR